MTRECAPSTDEEAPKLELTATIWRDGTARCREAVSVSTIQVLLGSPEGVRDLAKMQYPRVGHCIYCGATNDLRREHIVPFGLDGTAVLPKASCAGCARITSAFERQVLRGPMRAVRVLRKLRSRSRHAGAPGTERLRVFRDGAFETLELPIDEYPVLLHFPTFAPPGALTGQHGSGITLSGVTSVLFGPSPEETLRRLGGQRIILDSPPYQPIAFARMLAKIGWATAIAEGVQDRIDEPAPILPSIRGEVDDIGQWVGTLTDPVRKYPELLHRILIHEDRSKGMLIAEVQLFSDSETPSYGVILGRLRTT
jgi:hypothetical protein